ncbi:MAG: aspartyl protease family protein, partial [Pseudonocardiaceae bacterium]
ILDTGAGGTVISENAARELGLKLEGQADASVQGGSIEAAFVKNASLRLSQEVELPNLTLLAIRLNGLEAGLGRKVDGILGLEIFNRFVTVIDYESKSINFYEPQYFKYSGRGKTIPITIEDSTPFVRAKVFPVGRQSFEGKFLINTGLTGTLTFNSPFVVQNTLLNLVANTKAITFGSILAGRSVGRIGRVSNLQFGGFVIPNPVANFSQDATGDDADTEFAGEIGSEILRRFKLIIDYSRKQIILEPNKQFPAAYEFDMSGASLAAGGEGFKTFKVRSLIENSPATDAGLRVGDVITAINGKPTAEMTLGQIRQIFRRAGQTYKLNVKRDESLSQITLKTR